MLPSVQISVSPLTDIDDETVTTFANLLPQLSSSARPPDRDALAAIIAHEAITVFVARREPDELRDAPIVGTLTLVIVPLPTGIRAHIEDVVVDAAARGHGVGERLTRAALEYASEHGARTVDLTSRPSREAANRLYRRMGFQQRESNTYRYTLE
jgi:ribosomal protein S18 acetylase RimI-like enzyme